MPPGAPPEVVLVTVKAYDTSRAVEELKPYWQESTFLSLQNGLGNEDVLADKAAKVLGGVTGQGVTFVGPGEVFHAGVGETYVGPVKGVDSEEAMRVVEAFGQCGMPCSLSQNIRRELLLKAIINACINPLTALLGIRNGTLATVEPLRELVERVAEEGVAIGAAEGIELDPKQVIQRVWSVAEATADNKSSMLQDVERGRRTEIDSINGALVELGRSSAIDCPFNSALTLLVRAKEQA